jgi:hypothetical protein
VSGNALGYLPLAVVAAATVLLWMFLTETKPHVYEE